MELDIIKIIWNSFLTIGVMVGGFLWNNLMEKHKNSNEQISDLQKEVTKVKVEYVQKEEIHRIEQRIDNRFAEMKEFFSHVVRHSKNDLS